MLIGTMGTMGHNVVLDKDRIYVYDTDDYTLEKCLGRELIRYLRSGGTVKNFNLVEDGNKMVYCGCYGEDFNIIGSDIIFLCIGYGQYRILTPDNKMYMLDSNELRSVVYDMREGSRVKGCNVDGVLNVMYAGGSKLHFLLFRKGRIAHDVRDLSGFKCDEYSFAKARKELLLGG